MIPFEESANFIKTAAFQKALEARSVLYAVGSVPLLAMDRYISGTRLEEISKLQQTMVAKEIKKLIAADAKGFASGTYPASLLLTPPPPDRILRLTEVYLDGIKVAANRRKKKQKVFNSKAQKELQNYPEYYQRNFHFQTDGYLSEASARIYNLQVEFLFKGTADPMRRRLLPPMKEWGGFKTILEVGCGSGSMTKMLAETFPNARITAVDMSPHYISYAKKHCRGYKNIDFVVGTAEDLPFKDHHFDASVSVFLLHELPKNVRMQVIEETQRVCKQDGFWGVIDSLQLGDIPEFDFFLKSFPLNFHEPFYKDYISRPIRELMNSDKPFLEESHFLSKLFCRKKIEVMN